MLESQLKAQTTWKLTVSDQNFSKTLPSSGWALGQVT